MPKRRLTDHAEPKKAKAARTISSYFSIQGFLWQFWEGALGPFRLGK